VPGRALTPDGLHLQVALPRVDGTPTDEGLQPALEDAAATIAARWPGRRAEPIRLLPARVDPARLPAPTRAAIAVGVEERTLGPVAVELTGTDPHLLVFGDSGAGKTALLRLLARGLAGAFSPDELALTVVDVRRGLVDLAGIPHITEFATSPPAAAAAATRLAGELQGRLSTGGGGVEELLRGPTWEGPRHVLLVDDYDLLAGPAGGPLGPLLDLLPLGRDVGLHVVLARRVGGSARGAYEPVFGRLRELSSPGVLLDGDPGEGPLLGGHKARPQPPGRGLFVRRGERALTVQLAHAEPEAGGAAPPRLRAVS
jgi:S-DNA-T family DNA segregation ATPase FtsK/SpoIIIE